MIESLQKEEMLLMFSHKEVDFVTSLFDNQHDFNSTSLEANKIWQSFYLGRMLNRNLHKVVYKKLQKKAPFVLDSVIESAFQINVRRKEIVFDQCTRSHSQRNTGRPVKNWLICPKVDKTFIEFIASDFHNPLSSKSQMLDGPTITS